MAVKEKEKIVSREFPEYIREPNPDVGLDELIKDQAGADREDDHGGAGSTDSEDTRDT